MTLKVIAPPNLIERYQKGEVVVVTGTGVTSATVSEEQREIASWIGLIKHGLEYCRDLPKAKEKTIDLHLENLSVQPVSRVDPGEMFDASDYLTRLLQATNPPKFGVWLNNTVGELKVIKNELIQAIAALNCPILTLNYDNLMETELQKVSSTWKDIEDFQLILDKTYDRILHIHGFFSKTDSVIFNSSSYASIKADEPIQQILRAVALTKTILFIGCGATLGDPNWKPILNMIQGMFNQRDVSSNVVHYFLTREEDIENHKDFPGMVIPISYGSDYSDLVPFLTYLKNQALPQRLRVKDSEGQKQLAWDAALERYKRWLEGEHGTISNYLMHRPISFDGLFAGVRLLDKPEAMRMHSIEIFESQTFFEQFGQDKNSLPKDGMQMVKEHKKLYVLGKPGAGKTTFLKHLLHITLKKEDNQIPFFISLKDWSDQKTEEPDLQLFLKEQLLMGAGSFAEIETYLTEKISSGNAIILLDGLDEVNLENQQRDKIITAIKFFCKQFPKCLFILTCRIAAIEYNFEQFEYVQIADFSKEQIQLFSKNWFSEQSGLADKFLKELYKPQNKGFLDLAGVPLLLSLICVEFDATRKFPNRKTEIYTHALDALLLKWDSSRSITRNSEIYKGLFLTRKHELFEKIAYDMFSRGKIFFSEELLVQQIENYLSTIPTVERIGTPTPVVGEGNDILQAIEEQHGILLPRARKVHSFAHLTFQEFYTARYIAAHPIKFNLNNLIRHAVDSRWKEVLILTSSEFTNENAVLFLEEWKSYIIELPKSDTKKNLLFQEIDLKLLNNHNLSIPMLFTRLSYLHNFTPNKLTPSSAELLLQLYTSSSLVQSMEFQYLFFTSSILKKLLDIFFESHNLYNLLINPKKINEIANTSNILNKLSKIDLKSLNLLFFGLSKEINDSLKNDTDELKYFVKNPSVRELSDYIDKISHFTFKIYESIYLSINDFSVVYFLELIVAIERLMNYYKVLKDNIKSKFYILNMFKSILKNIKNMIEINFNQNSLFLIELNNLDLENYIEKDIKKSISKFRNLCNKYLNNIFEPLNINKENLVEISLHINHLSKLNGCLEQVAISKELAFEIKKWIYKMEYSDLIPGLDDN